MTSSSGNTTLATLPSPAGAGSHDIPTIMVSEYRQIVFSNEALRVALFELERRQKIKPPPGVIVACQLAEDHPMRARLTFHNALLDEQHVVEVDENSLAAALIHYCIKEHIPIPKEAKKCLKLVDGSISLNFTLYQNGGEDQRCVTLIG
jgi:hypothetical protein